MIARLALHWPLWRLSAAPMATRFGVALQSDSRAAYLLEVFVDLYFIASCKASAMPALPVVIIFGALKCVFACSSTFTWLQHSSRLQARVDTLQHSQITVEVDALQHAQITAEFGVICVVIATVVILANISNMYLHLHWS